MYAQHRLFIMILFSSLLWVSCGPAQLCTPQQTATCTCPDNKTGTKTCSDDGTQYSDCACSSNEPSPEQSPEQTEDASTKEEHIKEQPREDEPIVEKECSPNESRSCYTGDIKTKDVGECKAGQQICTNEGAWGPCLGEILPTTESCNGKDDDCNGTIDNTYPEKDKACDTQKPGICKDGVYQCTSGKLECKQTNTSTTEECNDKDDDCDGKIDEDLKRDCYSGAANTEGVGLCKKGEQTCAAGKWGVCQSEVIPQSEVCNGKDDDCNGTIDDSTATTLCSANQTCESGTCYTQCQQDTDCPNKTTCQNKLCKTYTCQAPLQACVHECVDTSKDIKHCGSCGKTCSGDEACQNSTCVCDTNTSMVCSGTCTNITSDDSNCGACGTTCTNTTFCFQKKCSDSWARDVILDRSMVLAHGIRGITVDSQGNTYIAGYFKKSAIFGNITITTPNFDPTASAFLAKLDKKGNWLWAKRVIYSSSDAIWKLTIDDKDNIYLTGSVGAGGKFGNLTPVVNSGFVAKMDTTGKWIWVSPLTNQYAHSLKYSKNALFFFGSWANTSLFVGKINTVTGKWIWSKIAGSKDIDYAGGFGIDANDNVYISCGVGRNAKFGSITLNNTKTIGILAKIDTNGNWLWVKPAIYSDMTTDPQGNSYFIGRFSNSFTIGTFTLTAKGARDMYIVKFDTNGTCTWAKSYGVAGGYTGSSLIKYLPNGELYILGSSSKSLQLGSYTVDLTKSKFFEAKMDTNGNWKALRQRIVTSSGSLANFGFAISNGRLYGAGEYSGVVTIGGHTLPSSYQGIVWSLPSL